MMDPNSEDMLGIAIVIQHAGYRIANRHTVAVLQPLRTGFFDRYEIVVLDPRQRSFFLRRMRVVGRIDTIMMKMIIVGADCVAIMKQLCRSVEMETGMKVSTACCEKDFYNPKRQWQRLNPWVDMGE